MSNSKTNGRVLVVDDKKINCILVSMELEQANFEVTIAASGAECLQRVHTVHPEVILLDVHLQPLSGIETCRQLKTKSETKHIPVLFITNVYTDELIIAALTAGGNDFVSKPYSAPILIARLKSQVRLSRTYRRLQYLVAFDELTGAHTRRYLIEGLKKAIKMLTRNHHDVLSCLLVDIDRFKTVNDELGHVAGDRVLRQVHDNIKDSTRETDLLARLGGDEFVVLLYDTDTDSAICVAEKLRKDVEAHCSPVTVSVGVATLYPRQARDIMEKKGIDCAVQGLIMRADTAMYRAKNEGRNRVCAKGLTSDNLLNLVDHFDKMSSKV